MGLSRRDFLKLSAAAPVGAVCISLAADSKVEAAGRPGSKSKRPYDLTMGARQKKNAVCAMCPVGCALTTYASAENITHIEGDQSSPISRGGICSKALALSFLNRSKTRVGLVMAGKAMEQGRAVEISPHGRVHVLETPPAVGKLGREGEAQRAQLVREPQGREPLQQRGARVRLQPVAGGDARKSAQRLR